MRLSEYMELVMETKPLEVEIGLLHERICSALGDPTRILILYLLSEKGMFVNEMADALDIPQSSISRHLRILRERSLVETERQGTAVLYTLPDKRIITALDLMREILSSQLRQEAKITSAIHETNSSEKKE
ncbi:MAG: ArsR family transcriptional regulator, zinc-responsive transcriptional repressor [Chloroflexota bacterium]|nr:ArsR family transcriptional regulator, zinc-responsive transcriptional repressor [Chloroflexota bacterium]